MGNAFSTTGDDGREDGTVADLRELLEQDITVCLRTLYVSGKSYTQQVMMYTGDADYNCMAQIARPDVGHDVDGQDQPC